MLKAQESPDFNGNPLADMAKAEDCSQSRFAASNKIKAPSL